MLFDDIFPRCCENRSFKELHFAEAHAAELLGAWPKVPFWDFLDITGLHAILWGQKHSKATSSAFW